MRQNKVFNIKIHEKVIFEVILTVDSKNVRKYMNYYYRISSRDRPGPRPRPRRPG